jgi:hypothetical protein
MGGPPPPVARPHNYDTVTDLVAVRSDKAHGRMSAKRLLPIARAAGYQGSDRNFRRLVAEQKVLWRIATAHRRLPGYGTKLHMRLDQLAAPSHAVTKLCQALSASDTAYAGNTPTVRYSATSHGGPHTW